MFDRISKGMWWDQGLSIVEGCAPVNCVGCWSAAQTFMRQFNPNEKIKARYQDLVTSTTHGPAFNGKIRIMHESIDRPRHRKIPTVYAIWNDLFHECVDFITIINTFSMMAECPHHVFIILTQRIERAKTVLDCVYHQVESRLIPQNIVIGTTIRTKKDLFRIPHLARCKATCRVLSIEPLCEDITEELAPLMNTMDIQGVFCGGPNGAHPGCMPLSAARGVRDVCVKTGIPFFFKSWGNYSPYKNDKTYSGESDRNLDGREWNQLPKIPSLFKEFFFTFGYGQNPGIGYYTTVRAYDEKDAREIMFSRWKSNWSFCYKTAEEAGVDKYKLKFVTTH